MTVIFNITSENDVFFPEYFSVCQQKLTLHKTVKYLIHPSYYLLTRENKVLFCTPVIK